MLHKKYGRKVLYEFYQYSTTELYRKL